MAKDEAPPAPKGADKAPDKAAKSDAAAEGAEGTEVLAAAPPKSKKKLIIAAAAGVLLLGGGAAAYFLLGSHGPAKPKAVAAEGEAAETAAEAEAAPAEAPAAEPGEGAPAGGSAQYLALHPAFVVNLDDDEAMRYLQIEIELMSRDAAALEAVNKHMAVIRNDLLMLFGTKRYHEINTREGKEKLRLEALAEVQKVLTEQTGSPGVENLYFTSLVMQ